MSRIRINKVTAVPTGAAIEENVIYTVATGADQMELYMADNTGSALRRLPNNADIQALIDAALSGVTSIQVVSNIAARDAIVWTGNGKVYVEDASDDPTVDSGGAEYVYRQSDDTYLKASEAESLDLIIDWVNIQNRPASTVTQIDNAVANSHSHANITTLDQLAQDGDGDLTYLGSKVANVYITTAW